MSGVDEDLKLISSALGDDQAKARLAKHKLCAGELASLIRDRLDDFSCKTYVYRAVSGSGSWYAVVYSSSRTPNADADRARAIADELALVYDLA